MLVCSCLSFVVWLYQNNAYIAKERIGRCRYSSLTVEKLRDNVCECVHASHSWLSQNNPYITRLHYTSLTLEKQNDMCPHFSLCTTLCLQWEPEIIAIALMYLAGKLSKFEVTDWAGRQAKHQRWWDMYVEGISMELLEGEWAPVLLSAVESNLEAFHSL